MELWNKQTERTFFAETLANFAGTEQLFYSANDKKFAYWPKNYVGKKDTLQARNSLIGNFTEKWVRSIVQEVINDTGLHAVQGAICEDLALPSNSSADVVISKSSDLKQKASDILLIMEVKMSIVWNWEYINNNELICVGDFTTHSGRPSILRSDSVLKAIGKSMNIRMSSDAAKTIPIIVIGNTPISSSYTGKIDKLKKSGILQGFWSLNPNPCDGHNRLNIKTTQGNGFLRIDCKEELKQNIKNLLEAPLTFFSSMKTNAQLGKLIELSDSEQTYEDKGKKFLELLKEV